MKRIIVITGHYGSGKTNLSVNLAIKAKEQFDKVIVVDLDLVNPYFRTADFKEFFENKGIKLIAPDFANSNLDIPSVQFDIELLASEGGFLIIDVGGDDAGAFALGRYSAALESYVDETAMLYVINQRRNLTENAESAVELMYDIEKASRMKHTAVVNNTNLGYETTTEIIEESKNFASEVAQKTGIPLAFTTYPYEMCSFPNNEKYFPVQIFVKPLWSYTDSIDISG